MDKFTGTAELKAEILRLKTEHEAELARLQGEVKVLRDEVECPKDEITQKDVLLVHYIEQLRIEQHHRFGVSSERTGTPEIPEQLRLFNEPENIADADGVENVETEEITYTRKKRAGKREEFYENLPVKQIIHELPEEDRICPHCGGLARECGREVVRSELELIPASVSKVEHVQVVYDCPKCGKDSEVETRVMVKSDIPAPVIPNSGIASPSLVAYVVSNKYVLALPLNRQSEELKRQGIELPKQNLANWVIYVALVSYTLSPKSLYWAVLYNPL